MKQKMNLRQELDLTRDGTAEMTRWCIIIALHQCFGVGKDRLNRIELRAEELGLESLNIAMQANGKGMPSTDQSRAMRDNWMPEGVEPEFRVPVLRAPRTRREQQLRMAGDVAASMVWTLYAKACMELLGYGAGRLNRLKQETLANYRQVNEEGRADGLDVAMEHLRRCACDALQLFPAYAGVILSMSLPLIAPLAFPAYAGVIPCSTVRPPASPPFPRIRGAYKKEPRAQRKMK